MDWKNDQPKKYKVELADVLAYLGEENGALFQRFCDELDKRFGVRASRLWSGAHGWTYQFVYSGFPLLDQVVFREKAFHVGGIEVRDKSSLEQAIEYVDALYRDGWPEKLAAFQAERSARTKAKRESEKRSEPQKGPNLNQCRWPDKVSRRDLQRLYEADAKGMPDEELAEDIGVTLYLRCVEAKEIWDIMERGAVKCRHCGEILPVAEMLDAKNKPYLKWSQTPVACPCGQSYTYREYRKSYRQNNMPRGEASAIFDQFVRDWERQSGKGYAEKMRLIDNLVHEFHVSAVGGTVNRPVGVNLIQGSRAQVEGLVAQLAYQGTETK